MTDDLIPIGEVAERFGLKVSALRYYDAMNLVTPAAFRAGKRWYGPAELRRLAFVRLMNGTYYLSLAQVKVLLDQNDGRWRDIVADRADRISEQVKELERARDCLRHFATCGRDNPISECPTVGDSLQSYVDTRLPGLPG
ncbi:MAG: MerR family transcriptional regulator [Stackebrandtia sp.]